MRLMLQDDMIANDKGDERLSAYSRVCASKANSVFEIVCTPRMVRGPQGDKSARFDTGVSIRVRFSFALYTRGWPCNPTQGLVAQFGELA